jgi:hypothetical protein
MTIEQDSLSDVRSQRVQSNQMKIMNAYQVANKANTFFESIKNEELPTPKKQSNQLDSQLLVYLSDKDKYLELEKFLSSNSFDVDYL